MMENQNNELEIMRQQLSILNKKLEGQKIVNDRLMREVMKDRMSWIRRYLIFGIACIPIGIIFFYYMAIGLGLSLWPVFALFIIVVGSAIAKYRINVISDKELMESSITGLMLRLIKMKKQRVVHETVVDVLAIAWVVWYFYDMQKHVPESDILHIFSDGGLEGMIIGCTLVAVFGIYIVRKMRRTNDEIIKELNEFNGNTQCV